MEDEGHEFTNLDKSPGSDNDKSFFDDDTKLELGSDPGAPNDEVAQIPVWTRPAKVSSFAGPTSRPCS